MLNIEKYSGEILKVGLKFAKKKGNFRSCDDIKCVHCDFYTGKLADCDKNILDWMLTEYVEKHTLTERERYFCMSVQKGWIARDSNNFLYLYFEEKPERCDGEWRDTDNNSCIIPHTLSFDFIRRDDTEPWSVEYLLKLEVRNKG